jgi:hypothetical protein
LQRKVLKDGFHTYPTGAGNIIQTVKDNRHLTVSIYRYRAAIAVGVSDTILLGSSKDLFPNMACTLCSAGYQRNQGILLGYLVFWT